jgi:primosomal protein N' (replication factor Y)
MFARKNPIIELMNYYEVAIADATYHQDKALTYSAQQKLAVGQLVRVQVKNKVVSGAVLNMASKPKFTTKEILEIPMIHPLPIQLIALLNWTRDYYPAPLGVIARLFVPAKLPELTPEKYRHTPIANDLPHLTPEQLRTLKMINLTGLHILHGDTGTGKTRIYIELARRNIKLKKSSLILSPEIGLTSQLASNFKEVFGNRVVIVHSGLSPKERNETWQSILEATEPIIVIGARSALFSPISRLGLIVLDESHDPAYKQDQLPYYWSPSIAARLAQEHNACLILGSATPLTSDYFIAKAKERPILRMTQVANSTNLVERTIEIVDIKDRTKFIGNPHISKTLIDQIRRALSRGEQSLIFLNRRGTARFVFCSKCAWQAICAHCDLPLVYHGDNNNLRCHTCGYTTPRPTNCSNCANPDITFSTVGTKAIYDNLKKIFPEARILRFDADNKKNERLDSMYSAVKQGNADIIVGTQTLAKGLDLPLLGVVGVISADSGLFLPDFSAAERTYQLLTQVIGRIGRGHRLGKAIVQTYQPDSPLITSILNRNWQNFYDNELKERSQFLFPPFCYILKISCKRAGNELAKRKMETLLSQLKTEERAVLIEGPSPAFHQKVGDRYAWQIVIKSKKRQDLTRIIKSLPEGFSYDIDPIDLL